MTWATTALKTALGKIVPQYWNTTAADWEPVEGSDGAIKTQVTGSILGKDTTSGLPVELASEERSDGANILLTANVSINTAIPVPIASGTGDLQAVAATAGLQLMGFSITEDAATAATARLRLHHGTANTDPELFDVTLAPGESAREFISEGIAVADGLYLDRVSGTTRLTLYVRTVV